MNQEPEQKSCPNCGKPLEFSPEHGTLFCRQCGEAAAESPAVECRTVESDYYTVLHKLDADSEADEVLTLQCGNCGAELVLPPNVSATTCGYCGSPVVGSGHSRRMIRPSHLLAFAIPREKAGQLYTDWLRSRWFLPGAVRKEAYADALSGSYLPFWLYDTDTMTVYRGMRGDAYFVTVTYTARENGKNVQKTRLERRIRWSEAAGTVGVNFRNLLVRATASGMEKLLDELEPWDLEALEPYHPDRIRGFQEESYSVGLADGFANAKKQMADGIDTAIRRDIGGDEQQIVSTSIDYHDIAFRHILLPVWISAYRFRGKTYRFTVNARTGEVQGERPWSFWKILFFMLMLAAVITGIFQAFR